MRYLLYPLWFIVSLLVMVLVAITIILTVFNDEVEQSLVRNIELNTGRNVEIQEGFEFRFNPRPTFIAKNIKMANAKWASTPWMLEVDSIQASLSLKGLLKGEITLDNIVITKPTMLVEKDVYTDEINWVFNSEREPKAFKKLAEHLRIKSAQIKDTQLVIDIGPIKHTLQIETAIAKTNVVSKLITLNATGKLHNKVLSLNAKVDSLRSILLREPTDINFTAVHGKSNVQGHGHILDMMRWQGLDIALVADTPSLLSLQPWMQTPLIETPKISANARFIQPEKWEGARLDDIVINSHALGGETIITGSIQQVKDWGGINFSGQSSYPLKGVMQWKALESESDAIIKANFSITGNKTDSLTLDIENAELLGTGFKLSGKGEVKHLLQQNTEGVVFTLHADSLSALGQINAKKWLKSDAITGVFKVRRKNGKLAIDQIDLSGFNGRAQVIGSLDDIANSRIGQFSLSANLLAKDVRRINELNEMQFPEFKRTKAKASIQSSLNLFQSPSSKLTLSDNGLELIAQGVIEDLSNLSVNGMLVSFKADSIKRINAKFKLSLPELGLFEARANLKGNLDNFYNINNINSTINNKHQIIKATGKVVELGSELKATLQLSADINSIENIPALFDADIKVPQSVAATAQSRLISTRIDDWSMTNIELQLLDQNDGQITGSVTHFPNATNIALIADIKVLADENLNQHHESIIIKPNNISLYAEISKLNNSDNIAARNLNTQFTLNSGKTAVKTTGSIDNISELTGLNLQISLSSTDMKSIPFLSGLGLNDDIEGAGLVKAQGGLQDLSLQFIKMKMGGSDFSGKIQIQNIESNNKPFISGEIRSNNLDLIALLHQEKRTRLFSKEVIDFAWLNDIDADINLQATHFNGLIAQLSNAKADIKIKQGVLIIPGASGDVDEGDMQAWLTISAKNIPYNIVTALKGKNLSPSNINLFGDTELIRGGAINIDIGLAGVGRSLGNFMDNAYGKILLQLKDSSLINSKIKIFGSDLIYGVLNVINPFSKKTKYLPIECGVIHFPIVNGDALASQGIAIKTDKVTVLGGGGIDFGTEELELLIKPKPRKGLGLSASTIANIAKISGSFADPKISIDSASFLQSTAKIGIAIASGGWTLLAQGLFDRTVANSDVCVQTLKTPNKETILKKVKQVIEIKQEEGER